MGAYGEILQFTLGGKLQCSSELSFLLCLSCEKPLIEPRQCTCGDRICASCYDPLSARFETNFKCRRCGSEVTTDECFKDRAAERELKRALFPCLHPNCYWWGKAPEYNDHVKVCTYAPVRCPSDGCDFVGPQSDLAFHLASCPALPVKCQWCEEMLPRNALTGHFISCWPGTFVKCSDCLNHQLRRREGFASHSCTYHVARCSEAASECGQIHSDLCSHLLSCSALPASCPLCEEEVSTTNSPFQHFMYGLGAFSKSTIGFVPGNHTRCCHCLQQMLKQMIKHLEEEHCKHLLHSKLCRCHLSTAPIQETSPNRSSSLVLLPNNDTVTSYRAEHHFCYLVTAIEERGCQK